MAKFAGKQPLPEERAAVVRQPLRPGQASTGEALTHEDGLGFTTDARTSLFRAAVTSMGSEKKFYTSGSQADSDLVALVRQVTSEDPEFVRQFVPWLRSEANMRTSSVMVAVEYLIAGGAGAAEVIDSACLRADEPAEALAYWVTRADANRGDFPQRAPALPAQLRKGLAAAAVRLYNQYSAKKYNSPTAWVNMGDVINLCHPKPPTEEQSALFGYLSAKRRFGSETNIAEHTYRMLPKIRASDHLEALHTEERAALRANKADMHSLWDAAGFTWERAASWYGQLDAAFWQAVIPNMGPMALVRNLRNFQEVAIDKESEEFVKRRLSDHDAIRRSRQFPYQFWSARKAAGDRWSDVLTTALNAACANLPVYDGNTLVLVDYSGSMAQRVSQKSTVALWEIGALFGAALAARGNQIDLVIFGNSSDHIPIAEHENAMQIMDRAAHAYAVNLKARWNAGRSAAKYAVGHGTELVTALQEQFDPDKHNRVVIFSDCQCWNRHHADDVVKDLRQVPVYSFDLSGYSTTKFDVSQWGRFLLGGFSDATFKMLPLLELNPDADFDWNVLFGNDIPFVSAEDGEGEV